MANKAFLLFELTKRDVFARYRGSLLGIFWSFLTPLLLLAVYSFVFIFVFATRFGGQGTSSHAVLMIFSGITLHAFFAESIARATTIISNNPNLVKKVVFPLWALPYSVVISALVNLFISSFILILASFMLDQLGIHALLAPLALIPLFVMALGFALFFASLGVYIRDISHIIGLVVTILLFMSPAFFAREAAPQLIRELLVFNPLTIPMETFRAAIVNKPSCKQPDARSFRTFNLQLGFCFVLRTGQCVVLENQQGLCRCCLRK